ncbi:MAG TPA: hypothetical protein VGR40_09285 [Candidatus Binatus sp.]|nr:hypothetical protein [Candidatus Binatus sp.]
MLATGIILTVLGFGVLWYVALFKQRNDYTRWAVFWIGWLAAATAGIPLNSEGLFVVSFIAFLVLHFRGQLYENSNYDTTCARQCI